MVAHGARSLLVKLLDMKMWDGSLVKYYISILVCPAAGIFCEILITTASGFSGSTEFSCMAGKHETKKRNSNLSPDEASSNPHCFCYCRWAVDNTIIAYIVCCGNFFHPPTTPEGLASQPELLESKTYHFRTPHCLINRVKSPLWMQTGSILYLSPLCVVLLLSPLSWV